MARLRRPARAHKAAGVGRGALALFEPVAQDQLAQHPTNLLGWVGLGTTYIVGCTQPTMWHNQPATWHAYIPVLERKGKCVRSYLCAVLANQTQAMGSKILQAMIRPSVDLLVRRL